MDFGTCILELTDSGTKYFGIRIQENRLQTWIAEHGFRNTDSENHRFWNTDFGIRLHIHPPMRLRGFWPAKTIPVHHLLTQRVQELEYPLLWNPAVLDSGLLGSRLLESRTSGIRAFWYPGLLETGV